jgi:hypothetical protein
VESLTDRRTALGAGLGHPYDSNQFKRPRTPTVRGRRLKISPVWVRIPPGAPKTKVQSAVPGSRPGLLRDCDLHPGGRRGPRRSGRSTEGPCQVERCFATTGVALPRSPVRTTIQVGVRREHHRVGACLDDQPVEWSTGLAFGGDSVDVASFDVVSLPPVLLGAPAPGPGYVRQIGKARTQAVVVVECAGLGLARPAR